MNLDDLDFLKQNDPSDMLAEIDGLPDQLQQAWELGQSLPLPEADGLRQIVIAGMGGSAIGADLLAAYALERCPLPVFVHRDYDLPAFARGPQTLVIASSHSGNTEETLSSFDAAQSAGCRLVAICTGGTLAEKADAAGAPLWKFVHAGMPRAAVGFSFGLLLALFTRLHLLPDPSADLEGALAAMRAQQKLIGVASPLAKNPAKRLAGQMVGRGAIVLGSGLLVPVARRWKGQINELAKAGASFDPLPEADHNSLAGLLNPSAFQMTTFSLFLRSADDHPRNRLRLKLTRQAFMLEGLNTDVYEAQGKTPLARMWTALHFGDYLAYYLAACYGVDPTPIAALLEFKQAMKG